MKNIKTYKLFLESNTNSKVNFDTEILTKYYLKNKDFTDEREKLSFSDIEDHLDSSFDEAMMEHFTEKAKMSDFLDSDMIEYIDEELTESDIIDAWNSYVENEDIEGADDYDYDERLETLPTAYLIDILEDYKIEFYEYMYNNEYYDGKTYFSDNMLDIGDFSDYVEWEDVDVDITNKTSDDILFAFYVDGVSGDDNKLKEIIDYDHKNILYLYNKGSYYIIDENKYQQILIEEYFKQESDDIKRKKFFLEMVDEKEIELTNDTKQKYKKYLTLILKNKYNI